MKIRCENHWYRFLGGDIQEKTLEELTLKVECEEVATEIIVDDYDNVAKNVCTRCRDLIKASNWINSPEGQAALDELDWEEND